MTYGGAVSISAHRAVRTCRDDSAPGDDRLEWRSRPRPNGRKKKLMWAAIV